MSIKTIQLPSGNPMPILGMGTAGMGKNANKRNEEIKALLTGLELGMSLIDTAEIYGEGHSEEVVGNAIMKKGREKIFLVSKVHPQHATYKGTISSCESSLKRLNTEYLDLYLLHWRGIIPLQETFDAFNTLKQAGKILDYGVSNFDQSDMEEAFSTKNGSEIVSNQVLYNLMHRGIEIDLLPWCQKHTISIMAYSPIEQGKLLNHSIIKLIALRHNATPAQIALSWILLKEGVTTIPKASTSQHMIENFDALKIRLTKEDLKDLDNAFPFPKEKVPLEMI